jgi:hypothetical protein
VLVFTSCINAKIEPNKNRRRDPSALTGAHRIDGVGSFGKVSRIVHSVAVTQVTTPVYATGDSKFRLFGCACGDRSSSAWGLLKAVTAAEFLAEPFESAGGIHEFLFAGEKRVAVAANIDVDAREGAAGGECVPTGTVNAASLITRMSFLFHDALLTTRTCVVRPAQRQPSL